MLNRVKSTTLVLIAESMTLAIILRLLNVKGMRDGFIIDRHYSCYLPSLNGLANDHGCHPCIFMYFLNIA